jgi:hypothetical protein
LRKNHRDLWDLMIKWDKDSPVPLKPSGRTVCDFDRRFEAEELGCVPKDRKFKWNMMENKI